MNCKNCNKLIDENSNYCVYCGAKHINEPKKNNAKLWIFSNVFLYILTITFLLVIIISGITNDMNGEDFVKYTEAKGCELTSVKDENYKINTYYETIENSCPYEIKFLIIEDKDILSNYYEKFYSNLYKNGNIQIFDLERVDYYEIHTEGSGEYRVLIQSGDSLFYLSLDEDYKENVIPLLEDYGYRGNIKQVIEKLTSVENIANLISIVFLLVIWWKINEKMGRKGWICLVPIYNIICLVEDVLGRKIYSFLLLIPLINIILVFVLLYRIGINFGKKPSYGVLIILFPFVMLPILAFDNSKYVNIKKIK